MADQKATEFALEKAIELSQHLMKEVLRLDKIVSTMQEGKENPASGGFRQALFDNASKLNQMQNGIPVQENRMETIKHKGSRLSQLMKRTKQTTIDSKKENFL